MKFLLITIFNVFLLSNSWAYTPKISTLLTKITNNNGQQHSFIIKRQLQIKGDSEIWQETWWIASPDLMKVSVKGPNSTFDFEILYKDGKRTTSSDDGISKSFPFSSEFYESLFYYRNPKALAHRLIALQVLPASVLGHLSESSPPPKEDFIKLDRLKGSIVYSLGASESKNTLQPPQLWVEQDSFLIKKIRMGSQIEAEFENYKNYDGDKIKQPLLQTLFWKNIILTIQTTQLEPVANSKISGEFKLNKRATVLPSSENIKEFYSRFR